MSRIAVSSDEMRLIDEEAITNFGIPSIVLMENAGKAVYKEAMNMLPPEGSKPARKVLVLCGKGNNGGDGLVVSRYLANNDINVSVMLLCEAKRLKQDPLTNFNILQKMELKISCLRGAVSNIRDYDLIIDAIFGTGFSGEPDREASSLFKEINESAVPVLSVDIPSGLDATSGDCGTTCVKAKRTVTFGLPKKGFYKSRGPEFTGEIVVKNIGFPASLLKRK